MCKKLDRFWRQKIMTMHPQSKWNIPTQTQAVARAVFPEGNIYLTIADQLGQLYEDEQWKTLYNSHCGQDAISPARLAKRHYFSIHGRIN